MRLRTRARIAGALDVNILELLRIPLKLWKCLEYDVVLIRLRVEGADLPLSERVVEGGVDLIGRDVEPRSRGAVVVQLYTETVALLVRCKLGDLRQLA